MAVQPRGYVQVYTGTGKGKTTAALGLCLRASGHGLRSHLIQFMKGQIDYGELKAVIKLGGLVTITQAGRSNFVHKENPDPEDVRLARQALELSRKALREARLDILVLDEILCALDFKLVTEAEVLDLIRRKPEKLELVLTGRGATAAIIEAADLVTEMKAIKHYFDEGVMDRVGIER
jgi:cob(I)alamin adenosyltransferase